MHVTDVGDVVVVLQAKGETFRHQAFALGMDEVGKASPARAALAKFVDLLANVEAVARAENLGAVAPVRPDTYRLQTYVVGKEELGGYQPAPEIVDWPADTGISLADASECRTVSAAKVGAVLAKATQQTFFRDNDAVFQVSVAPVLPGDRC